jgi:hypothetical protein
MDLETSFSRIQTAFSNVDKIETDFNKAHKIEIILETSARDYLVQQQLERALGIENFFEWFNKNFEYALKLIHERKGQSSFVIPKEALVDSEVYLENLVKDQLQGVGS